MCYLNTIEQGIDKRETILENFEYKVKYGAAKPKTWRQAMNEARDKAKEIETKRA